MFRRRPKCGAGRVQFGASSVLEASQSADDLWGSIEVVFHDWATCEGYVAKCLVAGEEPKQRQTQDSGPKRRTPAIQVPARERGRGVASASTASRSVAWPAVLFLAESIADLGEASPRSAVQPSIERGLANGHGCAEQRDSSASCPLSRLTIPAWSIASPMRVDCSRSRTHAFKLHRRHSVAHRDAPRYSSTVARLLPLHLSVRRANHRTVRSPNFVF
ncbi:hypothetical protein HPB52_021542 [Rhipicephalus sanguineus]|uniref:Uncharacterized protein n=1 Tax=Rhipicephalus sanguineus TaxID=34632 RepID=A0A9D4PEI9_RHISA|nr:hypothetical protein HPB52_021542 [Rhipicephalus sanguineus]